MNLHYTKRKVKTFLTRTIKCSWQGWICEDWIQLHDEVEWLRKLACDSCSSGVPRHPDGYHEVDGEKWLCDAPNLEED